MPSTYRFSQVDVFTAIPTSGNALAVVHDATGLSDETMAAFARWTNLSETVFLLPPEDAAADYRVRIFTPGEELPFAGHPTVGSAHAWLAAGGVLKSPGTVIQECGVGLVRIRQDGSRLAFAAPPLAVTTVSEADLDRAAAALRIDLSRVRASARLVNGPSWLTLLLASADDVLAIEPDMAACAAFEMIGVVGPYPPGGPFAFELRAFAAAAGVPEDPVTGSLNAGVAEWLISTGRAPRTYVASQGARVGRAGRVHVAADDEPGTFWIGGDAVTVIAGNITL